MTYAPISKDLQVALNVLKAFAPYSSHPSRKAWDDAMDAAEDVQAQIEIVEHVNPGVLQRMTDAALDEVQARGKPTQIVQELIGRYARAPR